MTTYNEESYRYITTYHQLDFLADGRCMNWYQEIIGSPECPSSSKTTSQAAICVSG